jgi:hypothetical protein
MTRLKLSTIADVLAWAVVGVFAYLLLSGAVWHVRRHNWWLLTADLLFATLLLWIVRVGIRRFAERSAKPS